MKRKKKEPSPLSQIAEELFKGIRSKEDFNKIVADLIKRGIETVLKAEMDDHLGNEKHEPSESGNQMHNGTSGQRTYIGTKTFVSL